VVGVVDVGIRDLLEVGLTFGAGAGANDVHGAGGAGCSVIHIAGGDVDLASVGGSGGGERGAAADGGDGSRGPTTHVEKKYSGNRLDDDELGAVGHELRIERSEIALAEIVGLHCAESHGRIITRELTIQQRILLVGGRENVNVRRIDRDYVLRVRRGENLSRDAGGGHKAQAALGKLGI